VASPSGDFTQPRSFPPAEAGECAVQPNPCPPGFGSVVSS
jgi:hypothetical protein